MTMRSFRAGLAVGFGVGYYLGAKAGRERYLQIRRAMDRLSDHLPAQLPHWLDASRTRLPSPADAAGDALERDMASAGVAVPLEDLPAELRSRVMAATGHARHRWIGRRAGENGSRGSYEVYAVAGDRFVSMVLALRPDGSVAEETETLLRHQIVEIVLGDDQATLEVHEDSGPRRIPVPIDIVTALSEDGQ